MKPLYPWAKDKPFDLHLSFNTFCTILILILILIVLVVSINTRQAVGTWGDALKVEQQARQSAERKVYNISADLTPMPTLVIKIKREAVK